MHTLYFQLLILAFMYIQPVTSHIDLDVDFDLEQTFLSKYQVCHHIQETIIRHILVFDPKPSSVMTIIFGR